jgi:predicted Zn-dependent protease
MRTFSTLTVLVLLAALAAPAGAQVVRPEDADLFTKSLEAAEQAMDFYGRYDDPREQRRVADLGYRIAEESRFTKFPFSFYLIDIPVPNAFALPGGQIFLTRGMLELEPDDDMLAGLLGHEIAHVVRDHGIRMQRRATLLNLLSQAALVGVVVATSNSRDDYVPPGGVYDPTRANRVMGAAAAGVVLSELLLRSYSREFEDEADDEGQRWAAGAGFDPRGYQRLMELMRTRLPENKAYGYWRTHPFFDSRVKAADVRAELLTVQKPTSAQQLRQRTQAALLDFAQRGGLEEAPRRMLEDASITAWPVGAAAERLRLDRLHELRDNELDKKLLARNYGRLLEEYAAVRTEVAELDPEAPILATIDDETAGFTKSLVELYPQAVEVLSRGVYETGFLERFLENFPQAEERPAVALELGDAYARLARPEEAAEMYLEAKRADPEGTAGRRALTGLKSLTPTLGSLVVLQQLAAGAADTELEELAAQALEKRVDSFKELANGSRFLKTYPDSPYAERVTARLNSLAEGLFVEAALYQKVGDTAKALERINRILTEAPFSAAAEKLRDNAVLES